MNRDESTSSNAERVRKETTIMTSDIPDQNKNSFLSPQSDLDVLAAVAHSAVAHAASDSTESMNFAPQDEASGWSDFLPQFELSREGFLMSAQTASREWVARNLWASTWYLRTIRGLDLGLAWERLLSPIQDRIKFLKF
jgi:hypothetical protein